MTDQADKAAEKIGENCFEFTTRRLDDGGINVVSCFDNQKAAAIIRSSTPDYARLVEAMTRVLAYLDRIANEGCLPNDPADKIAGGFVADTLRAALADCKPKVCEWVHDVGHDKWDTNCDNAHCFIAGNPSFNNHNFCPYCGGTIKVKE